MAQEQLKPAASPYLCDIRGSGLF